MQLMKGNRMKTQQIVVIAEAIIKPNMLAEVAAELRALVEPTRKEDGCIQYVLHRDVQDESKYMFYEVWASPEHLDKHIQQPALKKLRANQDNWFTKPLNVSIYKRLDL